MAGNRVIFHCDCNSFYASVELFDKAGAEKRARGCVRRPQHRHGIILAKNEPAKRYGIKLPRPWPAPGGNARSLRFCSRITNCTAHTQGG